MKNYIFSFLSLISNMGKKADKLIYWTPRILSILFLLFLTMFSLDVFSPDLSFWQIVIGLLMHNIPVFVLLAVLIVSWKHEIVGGIAFILAGLLYITSMLVRVFRSDHAWYMLSYSFIIAGPAFLVGILFLMGWFKKRKLKV